MMPQPASRALVVAEAGVNHNGSLALALELVDAAAEANADAVKFQTFRTAEMMSRATPKAAYQLQGTSEEESYFDMGRRLELDEAAHTALAQRAREHGVTFLSTAFDRPSIELLERLGVPMHKIPSGEVTNLPHLRAIAALGKPVLLSTGMADLAEVEAAVAALVDAGLPRDRITLLHCTTEYPAPFADLNLRAIVTMRAAFDLPVGYSDHSEGILAPAVAVALGATVIEKHLTLDRGMEGPDHAASLEPDAFGEMVRAIRQVEAALGDGDKRPAASEMPNIAIARRSIVAARPIRAGEVFSQENLAAKRPGTGVSPMRWDEIVGQEATRDYDTDEMIEP